MINELMLDCFNYDFPLIPCKLLLLSFINYYFSNSILKRALCAFDLREIKDPPNGRGFPRLIIWPEYAARDIFVFYFHRRRRVW